MAGRSSTNWNFYLNLIGLGMRPCEAVKFVKVQISAPYVRAQRNPEFRIQLEEATARGQDLIMRSPLYWLDAGGELILDNQFNPIPREPASGIEAWVLKQIRRNPLACLA